MSKRRSLGTCREVAEKNISRFTESIERLRSEGKETVVSYEMRDKWLEYLQRAKEDGTLDEETYL